MTSHDLGFPFEPYPGQKALAESILEACELGQVAVFESPTGSGKSMAVICAVMQYLERLKSNASGNEEKVSQLKKEYQGLTAQGLPITEVFRRQYELNQQIDALLEGSEAHNNVNRFYQRAVRADVDVVENGKKVKYETETREDTEQIKELAKTVRKVIYVSRTHSQLAQFVQEFQKTSFQPRPVHLGSRAAFCLNESVKRMAGPLVNCECQRLTKNGDDLEDLDEQVETTKRSKKETCAYYNKSRITRLRDQIWLGRLRAGAMEDLARPAEACPYYAARAAQPLCDVVAMPYSILFDADTRNAYGLHLRDNVVVVDEAHNFLETIHDAASFALTMTELRLLRDALAYYNKVTRSTNQQKLWGAMLAADVAARVLRLVETKGPQLMEQQLSPDFVRKQLEVSSDYLKIARSLETSGILVETRGIVQRYWRTQHETQNKSSKIQQLLQTSTNTEQKPEETGKTTTDEVPKLEYDGLVLISKLIKLLKVLGQTEDDVIVLENVDAKEMRLRYFRLSIGTDLAKIIKEAKAFIMVGGTMRPTGYLAGVIKEACTLSAVQEKQFPHVIEEKNVLPLVVDQSPNARALEMKVGQLTPQVINDYVETIVHLLDSIPNGVVVFLPNYRLVDLFKQRLQHLKVRKQLYAEQRGANPSELLQKYETNCKFYPGALLLASASGKLSEGINFADEMCRCVMVCGLPYPNLRDIEIRLRAKHAVRQRLCGTEQAFVLNACMRTVGQCVGRAIRHRRDHAAMLLMDARYAGEPAQLLPDWIRKRLKREDLRDVKPALDQFYRTNKAAGK